MRKFKLDMEKVEQIKKCLTEAALVIQGGQDRGGISIDDILDVEEDIEHIKHLIKEMEGK